MQYILQPPKGQFTKYLLLVDKLSAGYLSRMTSKANSENTIYEESDAGDGKSNTFKETARESELSHKLEVYTILGLEPGEAYK